MSGTTTQLGARPNRRLLFLLTLKVVATLKIQRNDIMTRYTQKQLKDMVKQGVAIDVTNANDQSAIPEQYRQIGYATSMYGCGGMLLQGCETGKLYAVTGRTSAIYIF